MEKTRQLRFENKRPSVLVQGNGGILIVEDEQMIRAFLQAILEDNGYTLFVATNGIEALQQYNDHIDQIDLVLLDLGIPELSGEEVLERILAINPKAKVISVSGSVEPEVEEKVISMGVVTHLTKPYSTPVLLEEIDKTLRRQNKQV